MANEMRNMIEKLLNETKDELSVDDIFDAYPDFDPEKNRTDVLNILRAFEKDGLGVLAIGRRNKKTRFIKGAKRVKTQVDKNIIESVKQIISNMIPDQELFVENTNNLVLDNNPVYKFNNRVEIIECLKTFDEVGAGRFIIGRRGAKSRFVKNAAVEIKEEVSAQPTPPHQQVQENIPQESHYMIVNNVLFESKDGKFESIIDALKSVDAIDKFDVDNINKSIKENGYFALI